VTITTHANYYLKVSAKNGNLFLLLCAEKFKHSQLMWCRTGRTEGRKMQGKEAAAWAQVLHECILGVVVLGILGRD